MTWHAIETWLKSYRKHWSPSRYFPDTGPYLVTVFLGLNAAAAVAAYFRQSGVNIICGLVSIAYIADSVLANTSHAFWRGKPKSEFRALVLGLLSFWNVSVAFVVLYVILAGSFSEPFGYPRALYMSVAIATTLGDPIRPTRLPAYVVITAQVAITLYFLAVLLTVFVAWAGEKRR